MRFLGGSLTHFFLLQLMSVTSRASASSSSSSSALAISSPLMGARSSALIRTSTAVVMSPAFSPMAPVRRTELPSSQTLAQAQQSVVQMGAASLAALCPEDRELHVARALCLVQRYEEACLYLTASTRWCWLGVTLAAALSQIGALSVQHDDQITFLDSPLRRFGFHTKVSHILSFAVQTSIQGNAFCSSPPVAMSGGSSFNLAKVLLIYTLVNERNRLNEARAIVRLLPGTMQILCLSIMLCQCQDVQLLNVCDERLLVARYAADLCERFEMMSFAVQLLLQDARSIRSLQRACLLSLLLLGSGSSESPPLHYLRQLLQQNLAMSASYGVLDHCLSIFSALQTFIQQVQSADALSIQQVCCSNTFLGGNFSSPSLIASFRSSRLCIDRPTTCLSLRKWALRPFNAL